jgi:hypothetical protein
VPAREVRVSGLAVTRCRDADHLGTQLWRTAALETDRRDHPSDAPAAYLTPTWWHYGPPPLIWSRLMSIGGSDPRQVTTHNAAARSQSTASP